MYYIMILLDSFYAIIITSRVTRLENSYRNVWKVTIIAYFATSKIPQCLKCSEMGIFDILMFHYHSRVTKALEKGLPQ